MDTLWYFTIKVKFARKFHPNTNLVAYPIVNHEDHISRILADTDVSSSVILEAYTSAHSSTLMIVKESLEVKWVVS
jgi:hypothetical protein